MDGNQGHRKGIGYLGKTRRAESQGELVLQAVFLLGGVCVWGPLLGRNRTSQRQTEQRWVLQNRWKEKFYGRVHDRCLEQKLACYLGSSHLCQGTYVQVLATRLLIQHPANVHLGKQQVITEAWTEFLLPSLAQPQLL